mmetsp:Transcript_16472/g.14380  ORF Transcript_16472/g.14380 Transcript_16472/m.14380 type:complete len:94 (-) Transcript_16472:28-309(-)
MSVNALITIVFFSDLLNFSFYTWESIILFSLSSLANYAAQTFMSIAFNYEKATVLAPLSYFITAILLLVDCVVFGYQFPLLYYLGFGLIFVCV